MSAVCGQGIWKYYGDYPALRDIGLQVEPGACLALLGRNGAGKTTLLRILAGLSRATRGSISVLGKEPRHHETRRRVGILGHGIAVYEEFTAIENLRLFAGIYGIPGPTKVALEWLDRVGLRTAKDSPVREFSRGMRQRLAVARAFLHDPALLLLDEPFTALDDRAIAVLQGLLTDARSRRRTVILCTHQLREAMELATHVALIERGRLAYAGERTQQMVDDAGWLYRTYGEG